MTIDNFDDLSKERELRAVSSGVEHGVHIAGVVGSKPTPPTNSHRHRLWRPPRGVTLRDLRFERTALGASIVRGTLYPSGEPFAASLWAISGRPGGERILQVIYTDRGAYRTGLDVYEIGRHMAEMESRECHRR